jgi:ubiquinone/menaquinone biosynthesis C-methylase UbiE
MAIEIAFDKIARSYDAQRAHPPEVSAQIGAALAEIAGGSPVLELGAGTGRVALPLAAAEIDVVGVDIAREMLSIAQVRAAERGLRSRLALLQGDIAHLPFADASFSAALAVHVLHLLPDWRAGLAEIVRVLRLGGAFIQGQDWRDPESCVGLLRIQLRHVLIELQPGIRPPGAGAAIPQALARYGGSTAEPYIVASWQRAVSPAQVLAGMAARVDAETWALPDELLSTALEKLTRWAQQRWTDLETTEQVEHRFIVTVTHF